MAYLKMYGGQLQPVQSYRTMTVILDLTNSDPTSWATYADDAVGLTPGADVWDEFFGHYPCILDNGVELGKLKRTDFTKYEDNTSAPITTLGKDVMICFPRRGIKLEKSGTTLTVSMTDEDNKTGYSYMAHSYKGNPCDKFYLGVYKAYMDNDMLFSTSGQLPQACRLNGGGGQYSLDGIETFRTWAQSRGSDGYELSAFFQLLYRQVMYCLKYKAANSQLAIGRGYSDGNSGATTTGGTNLLGMDYGESTGKIQMKLFGIEDFWGNIYEYIDGIRTDSSRQIYVADGNYNNSGTGYISAGITTLSSDTGGYMTVTNGTNLAGFTISGTASGSATTYFCDSVRVNASQYANAGGAWSDGDISGVFRFNLNADLPRTFKPNYGARLMFLHVAS